MDKKGTGEIGYDEFTLLAEENWKMINPYAQYKAGVARHDALKTVTERSESIKQ
jgi:hypothetical protein